MLHAKRNEVRDARMILPFNEFGYLPSGIYPATLDETDARFGQLPELRRVQMESVRWLLELARQARISRTLLNDSFDIDRRGTRWRNEAFGRYKRYSLTKLSVSEVVGETERRSEWLFAGRCHKSD